MAALTTWGAKVSQKASSGTSLVPELNATTIFLVSTAQVEVVQ
eukprot:CAMPEP_0169310132 /NCGR_PEP_ID=MMETSP1017-20121227/2799_1 /TAXON_ID=342587 /ORGANISM="Karlodinium micrum, Strain CCMP2283" /LENGTH=42 /DNA_ID= /DNA_START= /DNA_END= /DNA_ORIENTATION=